MPTVDFSQYQDSILKLQIKICNVSRLTDSLNQRGSQLYRKGFRNEQKHTASIHLFRGNPVYAVITSPSTGKIEVLSARYFTIIQ